MQGASLSIEIGLAPCTKLHFRVVIVMKIDFVAKHKDIPKAIFGASSTLIENIEWKDIAEIEFMFKRMNTKKLIDLSGSEALLQNNVLLEKIFI